MLWIDSQPVDFCVDAIDERNEPVVSKSGSIGFINKIFYLQVFHTITDIIPPYYFVPSNKGNRVISMEGYRFTMRRIKQASGKSLWRCTAHSRGCKVELLSLGDHVILKRKKHNHPPSFGHDKWICDIYQNGPKDEKWWQ